MEAVEGCAGHFIKFYVDLLLRFSLGFIFSTMEFFKTEIGLLILQLILVTGITLWVYALYRIWKRKKPSNSAKLLTTLVVSLVPLLGPATYIYLRLK